MRTISVAEVTASIDEAQAKDPGGVVAFDGDGTLWSGDVGDEFFDALLEHGLHDVAHEALVREAKSMNVDASGHARDVGVRIHAAYRAGAFPEERLCELIAWSAAGFTRSELDRFCGDLVTKWALQGRLHGEAFRVIEHARRVGIEVFVVSASPRAIVEQAARLVGIEPTHAVAVTELYEGEVVLTDVHRPIPYRAGKVSRLRERIGEGRPLYAAFGDNAFDVEMLLAAKIPVAIRPKSRLVARAADVPGLSVLETVTLQSTP